MADALFGCPNWFQCMAFLNRTHFLFFFIFWDTFYFLFSNEFFSFIYKIAPYGDSGKFEKENKTEQNDSRIQRLKTITDQELLPPSALRLLAAPCIVAFITGHSATLQRLD